MEKSHLHWKSEHPSIFISLFLLLGIGMGNLFTIPKEPLYIGLIISIVILIVINTSSLSSITKSLFSKICLVFWGYCLLQLKTNQPNHFIELAEDYIQPIRNQIIYKLNVFIPNFQHNQFAQALLIGEKTHLDTTTIEAYTALGIMHIIAISGMHLDMIGRYLLKLTQWWPKNSWLSTIELIFLISAVCLYTLIAHASPSILRACIFFCLFQLGSYFHLHKYLLNSIASGLLIILLFSHQTIYHIGWQLSYAAVIGIHLVYPRIQTSIAIQNPFIQAIWNNFSITLATQITTLPLLLFYFNSLSTGIILSNMIMIPLSNMLLQGLILLILIPTTLCKMLHWGQIIEIFMQKMTQIVQYIFTISPQPIHFSTFPIRYLLVYYLIFLYLCVWKKRFNPPLFRFSTKTA
ncbi:MAG: ComEC/Rec2 family competence protein [Sediminibacterium sp.]